jgi:hypothetical protein
VVPLLVAAPALAQEPLGPGQQGPGLNPHPIAGANPWLDNGASFEGIKRFFAWTELAFPDLRLQTPVHVGDGVDALVFSWPVHLVGFVTRGRGAAGASLFVEPALPTNHFAVRGLSGVRAWGAERRTGFGAVLEGGGVAATDGFGAFAGGGPAFGEPSALFALVNRRYFLVGADRWDFTLELSMPLYTLAALLGG